MRPILGGLTVALTIVTSGTPLAAAQQLAPDTSWVARSVLYEVFTSHFSPAGDFRGVLAGLDRIQATGATTVWLMPIHPIGVESRKGTLGSPYAARDFRAINPAFGTVEDLRALVNGIHARGMRVILDWVPDHTSPDHPWITQHPDWYFRDANSVPMVPRDADGNLTDWTDVRQLDYSNFALRREMVSTMRWWITEFGIDGYRVDVAGFVPYEFWSEALPQVRAATTQPILLLAEWGDLEMHRRGFDLTYGWDSYKRLKAVWKGGAASEYIRGEVRELAGMPPGGMRLRFTTNHDETAWDRPPVEIFGARAGARAAFVATVLLPGRPLLYNGQEVEAPAKVPLFEPVPVAWNQPHADAARAFYAKVLHIARAESVLTGAFAEVTTSAPSDLIAFRRGEFVVLVNPRDRPVSATVIGAEIAGSQDLLSGRRQPNNRVTLVPHGAMILKRGRP